MEHTPLPPPKVDLYYPFYLGINAVLEAKFKRYVVGQNNIPDEPAVYAVNHLQFADSFLVAAAYTDHTAKPMRFGAKQEYFDAKGVRVGGKMRFGRIVKFFMEYSRMIPVHRNNGRQAMESLNYYAKRYLGDGDSLALHPEGTRSTDERLNRFRTGAARVAIENNVPTVPVGLMYGDKVGRLGRRATWITFGDPLPADAFSELPRKQRADMISKTLEDRVAELSHQEQSNEYAAI